jgi:hypothetical protein
MTNCFRLPVSSNFALANRYWKQVTYFKTLLPLPLSDSLNTNSPNFAPLDYP